MHVDKENGLQDIMEMTQEVMMIAERKEFLKNTGAAKQMGLDQVNLMVKKKFWNSEYKGSKWWIHPVILAMLRSQEE